VHLIYTTLSANTNKKVNVILTWLWLEEWIQFSYSLQFAGSHWFYSCTNLKHQISPNSMNSMRVVSCLIVFLWMLRYHMKQGRYCIGLLAWQCWYSDPGGWHLILLHPTRSPNWYQSDVILLITCSNFSASLGIVSAWIGSWVVLTTGPVNMPAVWDWTSETVQFGSRPGQKPHPLPPAGTHLVQYPLSCWLLQV